MPIVGRGVIENAGAVRAAPVARAIVVARRGGRPLADIEIGVE